jgi:metal-dependent amidase/aminoacylase/carboxypeptidase family protein
MMTGHPGIFAGGDMVPAERTVRTYIREAEENMLRDIKDQLDRIENGQVAIFKELIRTSPTGVSEMIEERYAGNDDVMTALEEWRHEP